MIKKLLSLLLVLCLLPLPACAKKETAQQTFQSLSGQFTTRIVENVQDARIAVREVFDALGIGGDIELSEGTHSDVLGNSYYRFAQEYDGLPVYGRSVVYGADSSGSAILLSGNYAPLSGLRTEPRLSKEEAEAALEEQGYTAASCEGLQIYSLYDSKPALAWSFLAETEDDCLRCFVSADTGKLLAQFSLVYSLSAHGYGQDIDGVDQIFNTNEVDNGYVLEDLERGIYILNANGAAAKATLIATDGDAIYNFSNIGENYVWVDADGNEVTIDRSVNPYGNWTVYSSTGELLSKYVNLACNFTASIGKITEVRSKTDQWSDQKAVTLMDRLAKVHDFYAQLFQRDSFSGHHGTTFAVYNDSANNAYSSAPAGISGYAPGYSIDILTLLKIGKNYTMDYQLIGHEYTHSVERTISCMNYSRESGALMEGYSDIFGELFEDWANTTVRDKNGTYTGTLTGSCDWIHGDRNLIHPEENNYPSIYQGNNWADTSAKSDNGGVHQNSTVISHLAYLMTRGIDGSNAYEALSTSELARLFYETLFALPSDCTFSQFRTLLEQTAEIQELSFKKRQCVSRVFFQAGIGSASVTPVSKTVALRVFGVDGELYSDYTVRLMQGDEAWVIPAETILEKGLTFPNEGEYVLWITDDNNPENASMTSLFVSKRSGAKVLTVRTNFGEVQPDGPITPPVEYVTDAYTEERDVNLEIYNSDTGNYELTPCHFSLHLPKVELDSEDAAAVNREIYDAWYPQIQEWLDYVDNYDGSSSLSASYEWHCNGDILSLVAWLNTGYEPWTDYFVFNFSISTGNLLDNEDVIAASAVENYRDTLRLAAGSAFFDNLAVVDYTSAVERWDEGHFTLLKRTIADDNIDLCRPYLDGSGKLCALATIYQPAGSSYYYTLLHLEDFTPNEGYLGYHLSQESGGDPGSGTEPTANSYRDVYLDLLSRNPGTTYALYDMDADGIPELILCDAPQHYTVYSFYGADEALCGSFSAYPGAVYVYPDGGIAVHSGGMGGMRLEYLDRFALENAALVQQPLASTEEISSDALQAMIASYQMIPFYDASDPAPLG